MLFAKRGILAVLLGITSALSFAASNVIQTENALAGNSDWVLNNSAQNGEIEAYGTTPSINRGGGQIGFCVNAPSDSAVSVAFYRMGWYGGAGARLMGGPVTFSGGAQTNPQVTDPVTGMIDANWNVSFAITIPGDATVTNWPSGIYLAKFTGQTTGKQTYAIFTVRDDARAAKLLFQQSVFTYAAYNRWGGLCVYWNGQGLRSHGVSLNRPYDRCFGAGDFFNWEIQMVRFLERE